MIGLPAKKEEPKPTPKPLSNNPPRVEGSDTVRKPINRQAARVLSSTPWWAQPQQEPHFFEAPVAFKASYPCPVCGQMALAGSKTSTKTDLRCRACGGDYHFPYSEALVRQHIIKKNKSMPAVIEMDKLLNAIGENALWKSAKTPIQAIDIINKEFNRCQYVVQEVMRVLGLPKEVDPLTIPKLLRQLVDNKHESDRQLQKLVEVFGQP